MNENLLHSVSNSGIIYDGIIHDITHRIQVGTNIPIVDFYLDITAQIPDNSNFPAQIRGRTLTLDNWKYSIRTITWINFYPDCIGLPNNEAHFTLYMGAF
jgi:hypothetical protein